MGVRVIGLPHSIDLSAHNLLSEDLYLFLFKFFLEYFVGTILDEMIDKNTCDLFSPWVQMVIDNFSK